MSCPAWAAGVLVPNGAQLIQAFSGTACHALRIVLVHQATLTQGVGDSTGYALAEEGAVAPAR